MTAAVQGRDVVLRYGANVAVDRSTFSIPVGKVTALIGPNGSGKSTLLNAMAGLLSPAAGELTVAPLPDRPRRIAYVLQTTKVNDALPITVYEVVAMGRYAGKGAYRWLRAADRTAIRRAMDRMGVTHLADRHLHDLSGGQRQRVFVAQGLAQDHDILLLDEPVTGLDITSAQAIDEVIHDENLHGCTVVLTTHDLAEARVADHVVLLAGRVVASGGPDGVLTTANLTAAYGPSVLHVEQGQVFLDDPAHRPVPGRHVHRERSIAVESPLGDEGVTPL
jgi:manganese transport system ATP-binding protein